MAWAELAAAFVVFLVSHSLPLRPAMRQRLVDLLGPRGFSAAYSLLSLAVLGWLVGAAGRAPHVVLWDWAPWQNHVVLAAMLAVCLLLALVIGRPNPLSFGGARNERFDPRHPGLIRWMRHPILIALATWALAHLIANGDLAHVLLFGSFALFALAGQRMVDRRKRRDLGADWDRMVQAVQRAPMMVQVPDGPTALRLAAGLAVYAGLIWAHPLVFGVTPLP